MCSSFHAAILKSALALVHRKPAPHHPNRRSTTHIAAPTTRRWPARPGVPFDALCHVVVVGPLRQHGQALNHGGRHDVGWVCPRSTGRSKMARARQRKSLALSPWGHGDGGVQFGVTTCDRHNTLAFSIHGSCQQYWPMTSRHGFSWLLG
jgi:hypothetical protein